MEDEERNVEQKAKQVGIKSKRKAQPTKNKTEDRTRVCHSSLFKYLNCRAFVKL